MTPWRFDCIDCGVGIAVDEDGCCKTCGRDAVVIKDGVPDYSMVAAGDESHDDAALQAELAKLRAVAEAAARLQRWRHSDQVSYAEGAQSDDALTAALDAALPDWRSAP